jgi:hypothetical protein
MHVHEAVYWINKESGEPTRVLDLLAAEGWDVPLEDTQIGNVWFSPDGEWLAVQQYLGDAILLNLWGARRGRWRLVEPGEGDFCVDAAAFSPDGRLLVFAGGTDGGGTHSLERMKLPSGKRLPRIEARGHRTIKHLAFSPDERRLAAAGYGGLQMYPFPPARGEGFMAELDLEDEPGSLAFRPDGQEVALLCYQEVVLWDGKASEAERFTPAPVPLLSLAWSPDGGVLALGCADGAVRFWARRTGRETHSYDWGVGAASSVAFAPDGMTCAAGGEKGQIVVWDVIE